MQTSLQDSGIVELFFNRKDSAIEALESKYGPYMGSIAYNILGDREDTEECKNDAYLAVWNHIPPDRPRCLKAYLSRIIKNIAINRYKEKTRKKRIPSAYTACLDELDVFLESDVSTEQQFEEKQLQLCMQNFVNGLTKREKVIFICKYYYFDTASLIAKALSVSESTVSKELSKLKDRLLQKLHEEGYSI